MGLGVGLGQGGPMQGLLAPSGVTPLTIITSVTVTRWWRADIGITLVSGNVSAWVDQASGRTLAQATAGKQAPWNASDSGCSGQSTIGPFDGVDDFLTDVGGNPTGNVFLATIAKAPSSPAISSPLYGTPAGFSGQGTYAQFFSGSLYQSGPSVNANTAPQTSVLNAWARYYDRRQNNTSDYIQAGASLSVGHIACPTGTAGDFNIAGLQTAGVYLPATYREIIVCNGEPNAGELTNLQAYFLAQNPAIVV